MRIYVNFMRIKLFCFIKSIEMINLYICFRQISENVFICIYICFLIDLFKIFMKYLYNLEMYSKIEKMKQE